MEALGLSSGAAGLISLGLTVCQGLLDYYHSWKNAEDQVAQMYASIEALTETLKLLASAIEPEVFSRNSVQRVEESIKSAERGLQSLGKKLDKIHNVTLQSGWQAKGIAQFRRTLFPFKESTLAKLKELGIELRQDLMLALEVLQIECSANSLQKLDLLVHDLEKVSVNVDILQERSALISRNVQSIEASSQKTYKSVDGLVTTHNNDYCRKVYDWLSPLTVEFQKKHLDTFNTQGRQDAAAQSQLETTEFRTWLSRSGETLWCPGIQGTGKTIFASYIINYLQGIVDQKDTRLAYLYLSYKDAKKQNISNLLNSLVCQLVFSEPALPVDLAASYEAHGSGATRPSHAECNQLLRSIVRRCAKVFLIIDAFDEYPEEWRGQLMTELQRLEPHVNMLITSRNLPTIERQLSNASRLDIQARSDDILQYLRERIKSSERLKSHSDKDPNLRNLISTTIAARAEGMFLQARLHLDFLTTKTTLRKLKNALAALPEGLNDTYDETMERINSQHTDQSTLASKVICWVFYASRPLTMLEIQHALAVETGDATLDEDNIPEEGLLLSVCNGLVTYEKEGGFLALVHYTFQQYLEQKAESLFPEAQVEIVRTCLTYLSFDEFEQGPCHEDQDFMVRLKRWPLLSYAVSGWGRHARQGAEEACRARQRQSVDKKTTWGDTALHRAASRGNVGIVELLLSNGADITATDRAGNTPLHLASSFGTGIDSLRSMSSDTYTWGWIGQKVRMLDISLLKLKSTQSLLDHGADVNAVNFQGKSALHLSIMKGRLLLTQLLLERGADVTLKDGHRAAPLTLASGFGDEEVTRILLKYDLQRQVQRGFLDDSLRIAALNGRLSLLEILLPNSTEQPSPDPAGRSLLHISAYGGSLECLQYLENHGFDLGMLDKQKRTCLHSAAASPHSGSRAVIEYLLEQGLDSSQSDVDGWTPLLWAAKAGKTASIKMLLHADSDTFYQGDREWIPFATATYHEKPLAAAILRPSSRPLPEMFQTQHSGISLRHPNIFCDGCELTIFGSRHKCSECPDFDYCFKCVLSAEITHPSHHFDFIYWDDSNKDVPKMDRQEVMKELIARETAMTSWRA
ncbi:MAG: hypothetical protein Q9161_004935 [Pseudevernia consocians]